MASLSSAQNGTRRVVFTDHNGKRRTIYLGKMPKRAADSIRCRVEELLANKISKLAPSPDCAAWLAETDDVLYGKLVKVGLVLPRAPEEVHKLGEWLDSFIDSRNDLKPATKVIHRHVIRNLKEHFGKSRDITDIDHADADGFLQWLIGQELAPTTVNKRIQITRSFFRTMKRRKLIDENPFEGVKPPAFATKDKKRFVTRDEIEDVLEKCPDHHWRSIVALSRYGGLRCPSEVLSLRWQDIDWAKDRIVVTSPKTEHHPDGATRTIPLFPALREILSEADELAETGATYVVDERYRKAAQGKRGWQNANLRTTFNKIVKSAGINPWPRPFHNLRSSVETELMSQHPIHVVTGWLGNSPKVALKHYAQTTEADFQKAVCDKTETTRNTTRYTSERGRNDSQAESRKSKNLGKSNVSRGPVNVGVVRAGLEPATPAFSGQCSTN